VFLYPQQTKHGKILLVFAVAAREVSKPIMHPFSHQLVMHPGYSEQSKSKTKSAVFAGFSGFSNPLEVAQSTSSI